MSISQVSMHIFKVLHEDMGNPMPVHLLFNQVTTVHV